jgi:multidrug efflux system outer membrane protein
MIRAARSLAVLTCLMSGCANLAPDYTRPAAPVPGAWPSGPSYEEGAAAATGQEAAELPWRKFFVDPPLRTLIETALADNRDLRTAVLNIERSAAQYRIERAAQWPQVDADAAATKQRLPADFSGTDHARTVAQYSVGLGVSAYELDLFGRVRSLKERALAEYLATREARRAVQISLVAAVATDYLTLAADRERLALARDTLAAQEATREMIQRRFEVGISSELDLEQARTRVEAARVDIARYTTLVAQDENRLALLVGAPTAPGSLAPTLAAPLLADQEIRPGLSSAVLLRRPDVLEAEEHLKGLNANIGAARAAFFPQITLTGSLGFGSEQLTDLFRAGSLAWSVAPRVSLPIFDRGANRARLRVAEVDREIAVAQYEKTIQTAFREVADALAQRGTIAAQMTAQQALADATAAGFRLSEARFAKGVDSYLTVLDSQRTLYSAQQGVIDTQLTRLLNLVTLYKALGGGASGDDVAGEGDPTAG